MKSNIILFAACALMLVAGCEKPSDPTPLIENGGATTYILNEGTWGGNNAEISVLDSNGIVTDWFSRNNGRGLGDVAQDMIHYGNRLYVSVYMSNTIEVVDPLTGKSIKQIDMGQRGPRYLLGHEGKIYVSCYDKTLVRIDTATLSIEATCPLSGMQPEELCVLGENIYVCNSWQYDDNGNSIYDNSLYIIDATTFTEIGKLDVGVNPSKIKALDSHRLVVACAGNYSSAPAQTIVIDVADNSQTELSIAATEFDIDGGDIYLYNTSYDENWSPTANFYRIDGQTLAAHPILQSHGSTLNNAYSINVDPNTHNLYITNSPYGANADLYIFDPSGSELGRHEVGVYASKIVF